MKLLRKSSSSRTPVQNGHCNYGAISWCGFFDEMEDPYLRMLSECSIQYTLGNETEANTIMQQIKTASFEEMGTETINSNPEHNYEIACLYSYMNQADSAFVYLDRAYEHVLNWPDNFFTMPDFNKIKDDPRWEAYLNKMGVDMKYDFLTDP